MSEIQQERRQATAPQLRRMAKARPYLPIHEIRRTYSLPGDEEIATRIILKDGAAFIGLPDREARIIEDLVRRGELGVVFDESPRARVVLGVHGMGGN